MPKILIYAICAIIAVGANILLGSAIADFKDEFDWDIAILGLKKAGAIIIAGAGLYYISLLVPDLKIESLNLNLADALVMLAYSMVVIYVGKDIDNLMTLLKLKTDDMTIKEKDKTTPQINKETQEEAG